ncbi:hypothetical protein [Micromonospora deserti]|nr:hypothetical protein [Micromonospora deserti]
MISHMQAAARHLDDGSEHLARTMQRLVQGIAPPAAAAGQGALPRHQH